MVIDVGVRDRGQYTCFVSFNSTNTRDSTAILSTHGEYVLHVHLLGKWYYSLLAMNEYISNLCFAITVEPF